MGKDLIYCAGGTAASRYACTYLKDNGIPVTEQFEPDIGHLILDVPSFGPEGQLRMGGRIEDILTRISEDTVIYGGNLDHPALENYRTVDFLQDEIYLAENACITAECALDVALPYLTVTLRNCPVLILGWGRIGKCLGQLLKSMGARVTIAARKETDRAMIQALGYHTADFSKAAGLLDRFRLIINTVPASVFSRMQMDACRNDCVCIELASKNGIEYEDIIIARGLPGIHLPESSGNLIAETFLRYYKKEVQS